MINIIKFYEFQTISECHSSKYYCKESFLPISYELTKGNLYGFVGDYGSGAWGFVNSACGNCTSEYTGKVFLNGVEISPKSLKKLSCTVCESIFEELKVDNIFLSPKDYIDRALHLSKQPFSVEQIQEMFCISNERFGRPLSLSSGEIWQVSIAINFALGKEIFAYPWLNCIDIDRLEIAYKHKIINLLKRYDKIILVPSSQKNFLMKYCDGVVIFNRNKMIYK